jgi:hypothetical protein
MMWTAIVGIFATVIGFLGVVVGAAVTGFVTLRQTHLATEREREAQQVLREQERRDRRDAFQRETLLAVQDAISAMGKSVLHELSRRQFDERSSGTWHVSNESEWDDPPRTVMLLEARIFDDELRKLVADCRGWSVEALLAESSEDMEKRQAVAAKFARLAHKRVGAILPGLY